MKRCLACRKEFASAAWECPACGAVPGHIDGFVAFAPNLAEESGGFEGAFHDHLDRLQGNNFWFRARNRLVADLVLRHSPGASSVFEIGCGTAYVLSAIGQVLPQARLVGSEIHASALPHASRRLGERAELYQMDARHLPFAEEFDLVCAFDVIEHIDEDEAVLAEMHRALRPGGTVMLAVPQHPFLWSGADDYGHHKRRYRRRELAGKCRAAGFAVIRDTSFVASLMPAMMAQRLVRGRRGDYDPTAELTPPPFLNRMFETMLDAERAAISAGVRLPFGGSRFVVARKEAA